MNIYVGNLSYKASEDGLKELFEQHGSVDSVRIITDRNSGRSKGFAFVEMSDDDAEQAIEALNGQEFLGRPLSVNEARGKRENSRENSNSRRNYNR
ncbi:MAG: RNA-binding protein [Candidatus Kapabacteria bacterium]|nr:RNA-binding protein [Candidatus Kapabacteria bacterium]